MDRNTALGGALTLFGAAGGTVSTVLLEKYPHWGDWLLYGAIVVCATSIVAGLLILFFWPLIRAKQMGRDGEAPPRRTGSTGIYFGPGSRNNISDGNTIIADTGIEDHGVENRHKDNLISAPSSPLSAERQTKKRRRIFPGWTPEGDKSA
jgi:hypothetical protein